MFETKYPRKASDMTVREYMALELMKSLIASGRVNISESGTIAQIAIESMRQLQLQLETE